MAGLTRSRAGPVADWPETSSTTRVLWDRCKSEPAVTVRDPTTSSGRLTRCNSWTDGESPDGKRTQSSGRARGPDDERRPRTAPPASRPSRAATGTGRRTPWTAP
ncbi:hypothetical protein NOCARDAX2BIS_290026 [Nocardioides sp. AX2bis]|nr:hypothetical protein NOCARDAX2BIS_290026 [Nocardioides sp. AX2bis]